MKSHISTSGIIMTMIGVAIVYWFSPLNESVVDGGDAFTDHRSIAAEVHAKNRFMQFGVGLVLLGSLVQIAANYWPD